MTSLRDFEKEGTFTLKFVVKIPEKLNQRQKELLEEFAHTEGLTLSGKKKKGKTRVRAFWKKKAS